MSSKFLNDPLRLQHNMIDLSFAKSLVDTLPHNIPGLFNPWRDVCGNDLSTNGPMEKLTRLAQHLNCFPTFILCGEAPGYQGCRHSGLAFTSERQLLSGVPPRVICSDLRLTKLLKSCIEPSATVVWRVLNELNIAEETILWNALQMHPHTVGKPCSNRTPKRFELLYGEPALRLLISAFPDAKLIAVGRNAEKLLREMRVPFAVQIRHPANGGTTSFEQGLREFVNQNRLNDGTQNL